MRLTPTNAGLLTIHLVTTMSKLFNDDFLDTLAVVGFIIGVMNYDENLSQSDKDDLLNHTSESIEKLVQHIDQVVDEQNAMLKEILDELRALKEDKRND